MNIYRTQVRIIADVLQSARDLGSVDGIGVTAMLRRANLSHPRLMRILHDLVASGLLEMIDSPRGGARYRISDNGLEFLQAYSRFEDFAQAFGLRL